MSAEIGEDPIQLPYGQRNTAGDTALFYVAVVATPVLFLVVTWSDPFLGMTPPVVATLGVVINVAFITLWRRQPPIVVAAEVTRDGVILAADRSAVQSVVRVQYATGYASLGSGLYRSHAMWGRSERNPPRGLVVYVTFAAPDTRREVAFVFTNAANASAFGEMVAQTIRSAEGPYRT